MSNQIVYYLQSLPDPDSDSSCMHEGGTMERELSKH